MSYLPPIDEALVRVLAEQFPDMAPDIDWSDREIMFKAGQVSVVRWLRQKQLDQDTEMVAMQMEATDVFRRRAAISAAVHHLHAGNGRLRPSVRDAEDADGTADEEQCVLMQQQLASALDRKRDLMDRIAQSQTQAAETPAVVEEEAEATDPRNHGPSTEPGASTPAANINMGRERGASRDSDVNRDRGGAKKSGKGGLRIPRNQPKSSAGVGLNIS